MNFPSRRHPSADIPDPEVRSFLRRRAEEVGVDLPPMGRTPRTWWGPWRAVPGPAPELPSRMPAFVGTLVRRSWAVMLAAIAVRLADYIGSVLISWAMGNLLDAGLERGLGPHLVGPSLMFLAVVALMAVGDGLGQTTDTTLWLSAQMGAIRSISHRLSRNGRAVRRDMPSGDIVTALLTDADHLGAAFGWCPDVVAAVVSTALVCVLMLTTSTPLGLLVIIGLPVVVIALTFLVGPLQRRQAVAREEQGRLTTISTDAVSGLRVLRGIGGEDVFTATYREQSARVRDAGITVASTSALLTMLRQSVPMLFTVVVIGYGAVLTFDGTITAGQMVSFFGYTTFLRNPINVATNVIQEFTRAWVGVRKMTRILQVPPLVDDSRAHTAAGLDPADLGDADLTDARTGVTVHPGRMTALVSADPDASAGVATRLGRVDDAEEVLAAGRDLRTVPLEQVRRGVFLSGAESQLYSGTLREEVQGALARARPARGVTELVQREVIEAATRAEGVLFHPEPDEADARLLAALEVADAHDVLDSLPGGLDGVVAEKGRNLSGGQRQRVALARAVAADAPVLIAVEPTSAVDSHTEARIARKLAEARRGRTTVVVTASPLVLEHCEEVVLLDADGRELARGTHEDLSLAAARGDEAARAYRAVVGREAGEA
ncbi:ABC transporter transmembrane domain-containing protein [Schaalia naturae]|uniref:ABC transporter transmembrane domain-containing protein n=1 Tax=Schaalia naturae TaxID=635203 RepID=A0ABW2SM54_9ACTO